MTPYEDLSRLWSGDLDPEAAEALHARIAAEPELQAAWRAMQGLVDDLADLDDEAPPAHLNHRVLTAATAGTARPVRWRTLVPWLVAAAAVTLAWLPWVGPPPPTVVPGQGATTWLDGVIDVPLGQAHLALDGRASISVEPSSPLPRDPSAEEDTMLRHTALGALMGAGVTVAVYEGTATLTDDAGATTTLHAGDRHTLSPPATVGAAPGGRVATSAPRLHLPPPPAGETPEQAIARLSQANAALQEALDRATTLHAMASGQLATYRGDPSPWPDDVPAGMEPDAFRANAAAIAEALEGVEVTDIDCEEFPCVALFSTLAPGDPADLHALAKDIADRVRSPSAEGEDDLGVTLMVSQSGDDAGARALFGVGIVVGEDGADSTSPTNTRTQFRTQQLLESHEPPDGPR